eukprot:1147322-Pelagomonas_calceolata.AAC.6
MAVHGGSMCAAVYVDPCQASSVKATSAAAFQKLFPRINDRLCFGLLGTQQGWRLKLWRKQQDIQALWGCWEINKDFMGPYPPAGVNWVQHST